MSVTVPGLLVLASELTDGLADGDVFTDWLADGEAVPDGDAVAAGAAWEAARDGGPRITLE